jgi:hypothetical protein
MARFSTTIIPLLTASLLCTWQTPAAANPVVGVVAGVAAVYIAFGAAGQGSFDAEHGRIEFSLAQVDDEMSRLESDCIPAAKLRTRGDLYDRLDRLRDSLQDDPKHDATLSQLDRVRQMPHGEEAYYVALMEQVYDYVGYPFDGNRYYVDRSGVRAKNPCQLPTLASVESAAPDSAAGAVGAMP